MSLRTDWYTELDKQYSAKNKKITKEAAEAKWLKFKASQQVNTQQVEGAVKETPTGKSASLTFEAPKVEEVKPKLEPVPEIETGGVKTGISGAFGVQSPNQTQGVINYAKDTNIGQDLSERFTSIKQTMEDIVNRTTSDKAPEDMSELENVSRGSINLAGDIIGAGFDTLFNIVKMPFEAGFNTTQRIINSLPGDVQASLLKGGDTIKNMQSVQNLMFGLEEIDRNTGASEKATETIKFVAEWAEENPKDAKFAKNLIEVMSAVPIGKSGSLAADIAEESVEKQLRGQVKKELIDYITPNMSIKQKKFLAESVGGNYTLQEAYQLNPSKKLADAIKAMEDIVSPGVKNTNKNIKAIDDSVKKLNENLKKKLNTSSITKDVSTLTNDLKAFTNSPDAQVLFKSDSSMKKVYNDVIDVAEGFYKNAKTHGDMLKARQDFDAFMRKEVPKIYDKMGNEFSVSDTVQERAVNNVRSMMNDFIAKGVGGENGKTFMETLKLESDLLVGKKLVQHKSAELQGKNWFTTFSKYVKNHPGVALVALGGTGAATTVMGLPALIGAVAVAGTYTVANKTLTSKALKKFLIGTLRTLNQNKAPKNVIDSTMDLINKMPEGSVADISLKDATKQIEEFGKVLQKSGDIELSMPDNKLKLSGGTKATQTSMPKPKTPKELAEEILDPFKKTSFSKPKDKPVFSQSEMTKTRNAEELSSQIKNSLLNTPDEKLLKADRLKGEKLSIKEATTGISKSGKNLKGRIVISKDDAGEMVLEDGRHLLEAYRQKGIPIPDDKIKFLTDKPKSAMVEEPLKGGGLPEGFKEIGKGRLYYKDGFINYVSKEDGNFEIRKLFSGKRNKGTASKLLSEVEKRAKNEGVKELTLRAVPMDNSISYDELIDFYKKRGFRTVKEVDANGSKHSDMVKDIVSSKIKAKNQEWIDKIENELSSLQGSDAVKYLSDDDKAIDVLQDAIENYSESLLNTKSLSNNLTRSKDLSELLSDLDDINFYTYRDEVDKAITRIIELL